GLADDHQRRLQEILASIDGNDPSADALRASARQVDDQLRHFAEQARHAISQKDQEVKQTLLIMAEASESLRVQNVTCNQRFGDFAHKMEDLATVENLGEIRRRVA